MGPELAEMIKRGTNDCEALRPHELGEEGGDASEAIARDAVGGTSRLKLLVGGKGEEGLAKPVNVIKEAYGYAMVHHLVHTPCLACMPYHL